MAKLSNAPTEYTREGILITDMEGRVLKKEEAMDKISEEQQNKMIAKSKEVVRTWAKKDKNGKDILALEESDGFRRGDKWDQRTQKLVLQCRAGTLMTGNLIHRYGM